MASSEPTFLSAGKSQGGHNELISGIPNRPRVGGRLSGKLERGVVAARSHESVTPLPKTTASIPSRYETILNSSDKESKAFGSQSYRFNRVDTENPGPASYDSDKVRVADRDRIFSALGYGPLAGRSRRFDYVPTFNPPGPGQYNVDSALSTSVNGPTHSAGGPSYSAAFAPRIGDSVHRLKQLRRVVRSAGLLDSNPSLGSTNQARRKSGASGPNGFAASGLTRSGDPYASMALDDPTLSTTYGGSGGADRTSFVQPSHTPGPGAYDWKPQYSINTSMFTEQKSTSSFSSTVPRGQQSVLLPNGVVAVVTSSCSAESMPGPGQYDVSATSIGTVVSHHRDELLPHPSFRSSTNRAAPSAGGTGTGLVAGGGGGGGGGNGDPRNGSSGVGSGIPKEAEDAVNASGLALDRNAYGGALPSGFPSPPPVLPSVAKHLQHLQQQQLQRQGSGGLPSRARSPLRRSRSDVMGGQDSANLVNPSGRPVGGYSPLNTVLHTARKSSPPHESVDSQAVTVSGATTGPPPSVQQTHLGGGFVGFAVSGNARLSPPGKSRPTIPCIAETRKTGPLAHREAEAAMAAASSSKDVKKKQMPTLIAALGSAVETPGPGTYALEKSGSSAAVSSSFFLSSTDRFLKKKKVSETVPPGPAYYRVQQSTFQKPQHHLNSKHVWV